MVHTIPLPITLFVLFALILALLMIYVATTTPLPSKLSSHTIPRLHNERDASKSYHLTDPESITNTAKAALDESAGVHPFSNIEGRASRNH